ncbi:MAG: hypothetical protein ACR2G2_03095 [Pseudonocardia sp.]
MSGAIRAVEAPGGTRTHCCAEQHWNHGQERAQPTTQYERDDAVGAVEMDTVDQGPGRTDLDDDTKPDTGGAGENRDRCLGSTAWEHEFEQRHRVAQSPLGRTERAIAPPQHESDALPHQDCARRPQCPIAPAGQRTESEMPEAGQLHGRDQHVTDAEHPSRGGHAHDRVRSRPLIKFPAAWSGCASVI